MFFVCFFGGVAKMGLNSAELRLGLNFLLKVYKVLYIRASAHDHIGTKNMKKMTSSQGDKICTAHKICCEI